MIIAPHDPALRGLQGECGRGHMRFRADSDTSYRRARDKRVLDPHIATRRHCADKRGGVTLVRMPFI
jgi:hypothetical protein